MKIKKNTKIFITGHKGMLGSAIKDKLKNQCKIIAVNKQVLDLKNRRKTYNFLIKNKPDLVIHCAAKVGGIEANIKNPTNFFNENADINLSLINNCYKAGIKNLVNIGSACTYPKKYQIPIKEDFLLSDYLEPTNEAYALSKILGIKLCNYYKKQFKLNYFTIQPSNIYGIKDNFTETSHVIPSLIKKFYLAKKNKSKHVKIWGTSKPMRNFIFSEDAANGIIFIIKNIKNCNLVNLASNYNSSIKELANKISDLINYNGEIIFDTTKKDGMKIKILDTSILRKKKWQNEFSLDEGLKKTYEYFLRYQIK